MGTQSDTLTHTHTCGRAERNNTQQHTGWGFNGAVTMGREVCCLFFLLIGCCTTAARLQRLLFTERSYFITTRPSNLVFTVHNLTGLIRSEEERGTNIERMEVVMLTEADEILSAAQRAACSISRLSWLDVTLRSDIKNRILLTFWRPLPLAARWTSSCPERLKILSESP